MVNFGSTGTLCVVAAALLATVHATEALTFGHKGGDGSCGMGGQPVCKDFSDRVYECDFGYVGEGGYCVKYTAGPGKEGKSPDAPDANCGGANEPVCSGEMMAGRRTECDHGYVGKSGLCVPYTEFTGKTGNVDSKGGDAEDAGDMEADSDDGDEMDGDVEVDSNDGDGKEGDGKAGDVEVDSKDGDAKDADDVEVVEDIEIVEDGAVADAEEVDAPEPASEPATPPTESDSEDVELTTTGGTESGETVSSATGAASSDGTTEVTTVGNGRGVANANGQTVLIRGRKLL